MVVVLKNCDVHAAGLHAFVVTVCSAVPVITEGVSKCGWKTPCKKWKIRENNIEMSVGEIGRENLHYMVKCTGDVP